MVISNQNPLYNMKQIVYFLFLWSFVTITDGAFAQISVDKVKANRENVSFTDTLKAQDLGAAYFSNARYRAERAAIRKERNFLEIGAGLQGAVAAYNDSWIKVSGGDNSIAVVANAYLHHIFTKNLFSVETKLNTKFGYNRMKVETQRIDPETGQGMLDENGDKIIDNNNVWFKNLDEIALSIAPSFKMSKNWSYGAIFKFRTQIANGFVSRSQQDKTDRKSAFMAPGYIDLSFGITYKSPKERFPIIVNMSPLAMSAVFVESSVVRKNVWDGKPGWQIYGLANANQTSKYEGGSSIQIDFDRTFGKTQFLRYRTTFYSFWGWITNCGLKNKVRKYSDYCEALDRWKQEGSHPDQKPNLPVHPTIRWENTVDIKATKYLTTTFSFLMSYNRAQSAQVQTQTLLSVGLIYTFKNK